MTCVAIRDCECCQDGAEPFSACRCECGCPPECCADHKPVETARMRLVEFLLQEAETSEGLVESAKVLGPIARRAVSERHNRYAEACRVVAGYLGEFESMEVGR